MINNSKEIIPGLYIGSSTDSNITGNIININKSFKNDKLNILNLELDLNKIYLKDKLHTEKINFEKINNFILKSYNKNEKITIFSDDIMISLIICIQFLIKYINVNLIESTYYVCKKTNIDIAILPKVQVFELFNFYINNIDNSID
jgi:hypothetical protein